MYHSVMLASPTLQTYLDEIAPQPLAPGVTHSLIDHAQSSTQSLHFALWLPFALRVIDFRVHSRLAID